MNKENIHKYFTSLLQGGYLFYAISIALSLGVVYYSYEYHLKELMQQMRVLENNIVTLDRQKVQQEIDKLEQELAVKDKEYEELIEEHKSFDTAFYQETYEVIVDILGKVNESSFNILEYRINDLYDEMNIKMTGSYLNLIYFFDFVQTIKANVDIQEYKVFLKDNKMIVELKLKVGVLKV